MSLLGGRVAQISHLKPGYIIVQSSAFLNHDGQTSPLQKKELFSYSVDLEKRVRADHPLRQVVERIDFSFVREAIQDCYGKNGNESVDPEIILKLMFLLFWDDIRSERELMRMLPERLDYLWFLGHSLDDEVTDHSVLSKARRGWGSEVFESLFIRSVIPCVEAGLVESSKVHMDGSLVDANASNSRSQPMESRVNYQVSREDIWFKVMSNSFGS